MSVIVTAEMSLGFFNAGWHSDDYMNAGCHSLWADDMIIHNAHGSVTSESMQISETTADGTDALRGHKN